MGSYLSSVSNGILFSSSQSVKDGPTWPTPERAACPFQCRIFLLYPFCVDRAECGVQGQNVTSPLMEDPPLKCFFTSTSYPFPLLSVCFCLCPDHKAPNVNLFSVKYKPVNDRWKSRGSDEAGQLVINPCGVDPCLPPPTTISGTDVEVPC